MQPITPLILKILKQQELSITLKTVKKQEHLAAHRASKKAKVAATGGNHEWKLPIPISQRFKASTLSKLEKTEVFIQQAKQALKGMADKPIEGVIWKISSLIGNQK